MSQRAILHDYAVEKAQEQGYVSLPFSVNNRDMQAIFDDFTSLLDEAFGQPSQHETDIVEAFNIILRQFVHRPRNHRVKLFVGKFHKLYLV